MSDRLALRQKGFTGFVTIRDLTAHALADVPDVPGVYAVLRERPVGPVFLAESCGGHFKGKNPTVSISKLEKKWVSTSTIVYVGKAGEFDGTWGLQTRLGQYMRFGSGAPIGHWGGRYIWQLEDSAALTVCWYPTPGLDPEGVEGELLVEFEKLHGALPFANLKRGKRANPR